jgi:hypothetical protein
MMMTEEWCVGEFVWQKEKGALIGGEADGKKAREGSRPVRVKEE